MTASIRARAIPVGLILSAALLAACDDSGGSGGTGGAGAGGSGGATGGGGAAPLDICPDPNRGTLHLTLLADGTTSTAEDRLSYALFKEWPPMSAPVRADVIGGDELAFPHVLTDVRVPPADLSVYACFDPGSDNSVEALCTDMELWAVHDDGAPVTFKIGYITSIELDLKAGTGKITAEEDAKTYGCEVAPVEMPATLAATLTSTTITPAAGDTVSVSLFEAFPPMGPPAHYGSADAAAFPLAVTVSDIVVGSYHVVACYDAGGDSPSCDGAGDVLAVYKDGAETVPFGDGETVKLDIALNTP